MREHLMYRDRSRTARPDSSVIVPLAVLFVSSFNGPTPGEAWRAALGLFFSWGPGLLLWVEVVLLNVLLYAYLAPIFKVHIICVKACEPSPGLVDLAMRHLNRVRVFTIVLSVLVFVAGKVAMTLLDPSPDPQGRMAELPLLLGEAAISGYFVGVILALQFERRLYEARQTVLRLGTRERVAYSSLISKVIMILVAIVLYMTLEAFSFAGGFYSNAGRLSGAFSPLPESFLTGPDLIFHARKFEGIRNTLYVFLLKLVLMSGFFAAMLWQLKRIISRPLATILDRLASLNSPGQAGPRTIDIVQNDEFAPVFREINALVTRQQGQLEVSRRRLEELIELAADPIVAFDSERRIRIFNPAAEAIFQRGRSDALGRIIDDFLDAGDGGG
ncbi:MAG: PAS domain-containing protein, partial [Spirochaetota bacterium]